MQDNNYMCSDIYADRIFYTNTGVSKTSHIYTSRILYFIMSLIITSYNCQSVNANMGILKILSNKTDILLLQETLLNENN